MKRRGLLFCSVILFVFTAANAFENRIQETKTARASYDVSDMTRIEVEGKNVQFYVQTGPSGKVEVEAEIIFKGKETDKIREFLDNFEQEVQNRITKSSSRLYIDADLDEPFKVQMGKKGGVRVGYNEEELKVTYTITIPSQNDISLKNSYRDIRMTGEYNGKTEVSLYSANFTGEDFKELDLELKFGKAEAQSIGKSSMELYEQKLAVREIKELDLWEPGLGEDVVG